jgi:hypothetical protein
VELLGYGRMPDLPTAVVQALGSRPQGTIGVLPYGGLCMPYVV